MSHPGSLRACPAAWIHVPTGRRLAFVSAQEDDAQAEDKQQIPGWANSSPQPFISILRSNAFFKNSVLTKKNQSINPSLFLSLYIYISFKVLLYSNKHIHNGTNLPTQQGQQNINYSRYIQQIYVNHLVTTAGLLCRGTPMGKKHWMVQIGDVCNLSCTSSGARGLLYRANIIPETFVNVSKGDSLI